MVEGFPLSFFILWGTAAETCWGRATLQVGCAVILALHWPNRNGQEVFFGIGSEC